MKGEDYTEMVSEPLIELLAIKLYEHDYIGGRPPKTPNLGWLALCNEDRETFRQMARGEKVIGYPPEDPGE